jgi:hypothetical protein
MNKRSQGEAFHAMKLAHESPNRDHPTVVAAVAVAAAAIVVAEVVVAEVAVVAVNADLIAITDHGS